MRSGYYTMIGAALPGAGFGPRSTQAADLNCPAATDTLTGISSSLLVKDDGDSIIGMVANLAIQLGAAAPTALQLELDAGANFGVISVLTIAPSRLVNNALLAIDSLLAIGNQGTIAGTFPVRLFIRPTTNAVTLKAGSSGAAINLRSQD